MLLRIVLDIREKFKAGGIRAYEAHVKCMRDQLMPGGAFIAKTVFYLAAEGDTKDEAVKKIKDDFCHEIDSQLEFLR